jgi:hypothetical protein
MSEQQSETTITVSGYGRKLCVLSEYVMRQAVCGYSAYGQRVLDAATRAATAVQLVAQRANDKYWCDEALMSGLTNTLRGQVADAFALAEKAEPESRPQAREALVRVLGSVEEQALAVNKTFVESALHELQKIGDELASIKRYYKDASREANAVERERFPALAAIKERARANATSGGAPGSDEDTNSKNEAGEA